MRDFQNAFDAALAGVDSTIVEVMGLCAQFTSGAQCGSEVQGVFDDPESLGFAGGGVRIEGSSRHYLCGRIRFVPCGVVTR